MKICCCCLCPIILIFVDMNQKVVCDAVVSRILKSSNSKLVDAILVGSKQTRLVGSICSTKRLVIMMEEFLASIAHPKIE